MGLKFQKDTNGTLLTNLIAHWKLDETPYATKGGFWKETLNPGKGPAALFVSANNEYLSIADNASLSMGSGVRCTFTAAVYLNNTTQDHTIFGKYNSNTNNVEYRLFFNAGATQRFRFDVSNDGSAIAFVRANTFGAPSINTWYFITCQYDGTNIKISVNNGAFDTTAFSADIFNGTAAFSIGSLPAHTPFSGDADARIQLVGVWKRVLTATEISQLYNNGKGLHYKELYGTLFNSLESYWNLNETFRKRYDSHGSNHLTDNNTVDFAAGIDGGHSLGEIGSGEGTILLETGRVHTAPRFTGSASTDRIFLSIPSDSDIQTGDIDYTVAGWIFIDTINNDHTIIAKSDTAKIEYRLRIGNDNKPFFQIGDGGSGGRGSAISSVTLSANTWYFIVGWHDAAANTVNIQVNNGTVDSVATTGVGVATNQRLTIGCVMASGDTVIANNTRGRLDEVFFWKKVLSSQEKTDLYNSGNGNTIINTSDKMLALMS